MPSYTFFDATVWQASQVSGAASFAALQAGTGKFANNGVDYMSVEQFTGDSLFYGHQLFFSFDTSSIPDGEVVTSATFSLYETTLNVGTCTAEIYQVTSPVGGTTWLTPAAIAGLPLLASIVGSTISGAYVPWTSSGSNFANAVNKSGITSVAVLDSRIRTGVAPVGNNRLRTNAAPVANDPRLEVATVLGSGNFLPFL